MTYEEARKEAEQILKGAEVPDAALDAWYLLEYAIRKIEKKETGRTWYLMNRKESILPGTLLYYQELVSRRKQRIPLQYLTGDSCARSSCSTWEKVETVRHSPSSLTMRT